MGWTRWLMVGLVLGGCRIASPIPGPDPHVDTYVPEGYVPPSAAAVVFLGDSVTAGAGAPKGLAWVDLVLDNSEIRWPAFYEDDLTSLFGGFEVVDVAEGGATTTEVLDLQVPAAQEALGTVQGGPLLVMATMGGNDVLQVAENDEEIGFVVDRAAENMAAIVDAFDDPERYPGGAYVYLANVYDPTDGTGDAEQCLKNLDPEAFSNDLAALNDRTRSLAEEQGWAWVDMYGHFQGHGLHHNDPGEWYHPDDPSLWFSGDCIHPNPRGHHEIRRLFVAAVLDQQLLNIVAR